MRGITFLNINNIRISRVRQKKICSFSAADFPGINRSFS
jgi:hypothetical protein